MEYSTDLVAWTPLATSTVISQGVFEFIDGIHDESSEGILSGEIAIAIELNLKILIAASFFPATKGAGVKE